MTPEALSAVKLRVLLNSFMFVMFSYVLYESQGFVDIARYLPQGTGIAGMLASGALVVQDTLRLRLNAAATRTPEVTAERVASASAASEVTPIATVPANDLEEIVAPEAATVDLANDAMGFIGLAHATKWFKYMGLLLVSIALLGTTLGSALFLSIFLRREADLTFRKVALGVGIFWMLLVVAHQFARLRFIDGVFVDQIVWADQFIYYLRTSLG